MKRLFSTLVLLALALAGCAPGNNALRNAINRFEAADVCVLEGSISLESDLPDIGSLSERLKNIELEYTYKQSFAADKTTGAAELTISANQNGRSFPFGIWVTYDIKSESPSYRIILTLPEAKADELRIPKSEYYLLDFPSVLGKGERSRNILENAVGLLSGDILGIASGNSLSYSASTEGQNTRYTVKIGDSMAKSLLIKGLDSMLSNEFLRASFGGLGADFEPTEAYTYVYFIHLLLEKSSLLGQDGISQEYLLDGSGKLISQILTADIKAPLALLGALLPGTVAADDNRMFTARLAALCKTSQLGGSLNIAIPTLEEGNYTNLLAVLPAVVGKNNIPGNDLLARLAEKQINISVRGEPVRFYDTRPVQLNERVLVPVRALFNSLGSAVEYTNIGGREVVNILHGGKTITLVIGSKTAYIDDKKTELDVAATMIEDRTMVPLRFIAENLGYKVDYTEDDRSIEIFIQ